MGDHSLHLFTPNVYVWPLHTTYLFFFFSIVCLGGGFFFLVFIRLGNEFSWLYLAGDDKDFMFFLFFLFFSFFYFLSGM